MKTKYEVGQTVEYRQNNQWYPGTVMRVSEYQAHDTSGIVREVAIRVLGLPGGPVKALDANGESTEVRYPAAPITMQPYSAAVQFSRADLEHEATHAEIDRITYGGRGGGPLVSRRPLQDRIKDLGQSLAAANSQRDALQRQIEAAHGHLDRVQGLGMTMVLASRVWAVCEDLVKVRELAEARLAAGLAQDKEIAALRARLEQIKSSAAALKEALS